MIAVTCFVCEEELDEPGALVFGPPSPTGLVRKRHLCRNCSADLDKMLKRIRALARHARKALP